MIQIKELAVDVGEFSLRNISLAIEEGRYFVIVGPTGVGKTVLLETIAGIHPLRAGEVHIDMQDVTRLLPEERRISYVPQDYALFPNLSVGENIAFGLRVRGEPGVSVDEEVRRYADRVGIGQLLERDPRTLSGGEKQRVALARALIIRPRFLLLDEPLAALDRPIRQDLWLLLKQLKDEFGVTFVHVTHDLEEAFVLGDGIAVFIDGVIEQVGTREELYHRPTSLSVARFLNVRNVFPGRVSYVDHEGGSMQMEIEGTTLTFAMRSHKCFEVGNMVHCVIRPEEIMVLREGKPVKESLQENVFEMEIARIAEIGAHHVLMLNGAGHPLNLQVNIPNYVFRSLGLSERQSVRVGLRKESLWVIPPQ